MINIEEFAKEMHRNIREFEEMVKEEQIGYPADWPEKLWPDDWMAKFAEFMEEY